MPNNAQKQAQHQNNNDENEKRQIYPGNSKLLDYFQFENRMVNSIV